jgi:5,10-methenyltetrahydrofolate synthetase
MKKTDRNALRQQLINSRLAQPHAVYVRHSATICAHIRENFPYLARMRVGFCWPIKNEPDLRPLMSSWLSENAADFVALLPVVVDAGAPLVFRRWTPDCRMAADRYGIPTPVDGDFVQPDALLIPVNAFDAAGFRLGYGGGFFDRTLAALGPDTQSIGVGFELARIDSIVPEAHDVRLDAMITEAGVFRHA